MLKIAAFVAAMAMAGVAAGMGYGPMPLEAFGEGLLWRVDKPGLTPSYVFGTIHLADQRVVAVPAPVREALDGARSFTMEIMVDDMGRMVFTEAMQLPGNEDLRSLLGEDLYGKVNRLLARNRISSDVANRLKPWGALLNLTEPTADPGATLDHELLHAAMLRRKPIYQLEGVEEQIFLFDEMPMEIQVALLRHAVERYEQANQVNENLIAAYLARDLAGIWRINARFMEKEGVMTPYNQYFVKRVIHGRSVVMAHRMQARMRDGSAFIAVGALHLYGENGVLNLLAREGYRVTRVY
ncbi:MAG: TraB/GumN family protein [Betaproteobacteria bacterium]|nr:TraB/GumN family protein [Betaproteobacteria bacterium]